VERGDKRRLTTPGPDGAGDGTPAVSPDGRTVAFIRGIRNAPEAVFLVPFDGGAPQRLSITFPAAHAPAALRGLAWSADGAAILVASAGIWKVPAAGGSAERVAEAEGEILSVSAARQGRRLVYADVVPEVEMWRTAGPGARPEEFPPARLIGSPDDVGSPNVARDGKRIAFGSFMSGTWEIWKCDRDGRNPVQLSFLGDVPTGSPRWSPDGKSVVFDGRADDGLQNDIYVVDAAGGPARRLTREPSVDIRPCYSNDQRWIYFTSNRGGTFQVWKIPAAGGTAVQVTRNGGFIAFETLDGKFLYYGKGRGQTTLWKVGIDGGEEVQVLDNVDPSNFAVCRSGVCILNLKAKPKPAIEFYSFATGKRTALAVLPAEGKVIGSGTSLAASPDGRWLVYHQEGRVAAAIRAREY
jgi:Tol biopolymer transport system component